MNDHRGSTYLGPDKGRHRLTTWEQVVNAAAGGFLDESPWIDLKKDLPPGRTHNTSMAVHLAAMAVNGGLIVIGIEDANSRAGTVLGVELDKLADRIDHIAREKIHPPLNVRSVEVPNPAQAGHGCLLVHVPPSPHAPHMVDNVYYGRGDRGDAKLTDERVRAILAERARRESDIRNELKSLRVADGLEASRGFGRLRVLLRPEYSHTESLVGLLTSPDRHDVLATLCKEVAQTRGTPAFSPDIRDLTHIEQRAEGVALTQSLPEDRPPAERFLEILIHEDTALTLICGRGTSRINDRLHVLPGLIVALTYAALHLGGRLADEHAAYQGTWQAGLLLDKLTSAVPHVDGTTMGNAYSKNSYQGITTTTTEELIDYPEAVTGRLLMPLLRGLGVVRALEGKPPLAR